MRRMATTKQLDYINGLQEVAEKGFKVGTYPEEIYIVPEKGYSGSENEVVDGELNWELIQGAIQNLEINFENHSFGAYLEYSLPRLLEQYGLAGDSVGYITFTLKNPITMPNSVVDFKSLKAWMQSDAFITAINNVGYDLDDIQAFNAIAMYTVEDVADSIFLYNGELKLDTTIVCTKGKGEEIVGASDPVGEPTLKTNYLEAKNIKPWYSLLGSFDDDDDFTYTIIPLPTQKDSDNRYQGLTIFTQNDGMSERDIVFVDFENEKVYREDGETAISLNFAAIKLVNMLNGEAVKEYLK